MVNDERTVLHVQQHELLGLHDKQQAVRKAAVE
jgi:hypothetical protein